jgi:peptidoglycan hydrolase-like protein with peptidoglycan-binding domain
MRALRALLVTVLTVALLSATAYATGVAVRHHESPRTTQAAERRPVPVSSATPAGTPSSPGTSPASPAVPSAAATTEAVLEHGDSGVQVRELQSRLFQLAWLPELTTGTYDAATAAAVRGFQAKRGLEATGTVDRRTWQRLVTMTRTPTRDQLFNVLHAGPAILEAGQHGEDVRDLQARLGATRWLFGDVTGTYDDATVEAVRGFQAKRQVPVTGKVDRRTLDRLHAMTTTPTHAEMYNLGNQPGALDARCRTGRVLCIDKTSQTLRWVVDGKVLKTLDVRFGASYTPTREGVFHVYTKDADHVSHLFGSEMPYSMFFSGGQAVHYSSDFAARGYYGASHGCVNVRDYDGLAWLFDQVQVGDDVVIYWS